MRVPLSELRESANDKSISVRYSYACGLRVEYAHHLREVSVRHTGIAVDGDFGLVELPV